MANFKCAFCGCEQTEDGKILKDGNMSGSNSELSELRAEIKELRRENQDLNKKINEISTKKKNDDEESWD